MTLISKAEFARLHGVSHTAVSKWNKAGWLVTQGSQVDLEASNAQLARYRDGRDGRATRASNEVSFQMKPETAHETCAEMPVSAEVTSSVRKPLGEDIKLLPGESVEEAAERLTASAGVNLEMPVEEAKRIKEVYLALLNQLEYDQKSGLVVMVDDVAALVGAEYAKVRTRLLAIATERAPQIHRCRTVTEVQDALQEVITEALEDLTHDGDVR